MLGLTLFFACIIGLCASVALESGFAFARVSARHAAAHYAQLGLVQARAQLVTALAAQIAAGAKTLHAPAALVATEGAFSFTATFALSGTLGDSEAPNVSATAVQSHPAISEGRVAATIVESVTASSEAPLAIRTEYLTLRTFDVPPYVAIDGMTDASAARDVPFEADAAGCDPARPATCDANNLSAAAMNAADTRIHALSRCVGACAGQLYVSVDAKNTPARAWFNGNATSDGWSR